MPNFFIIIAALKLTGAKYIDNNDISFILNNPLDILVLTYTKDSPLLNDYEVLFSFQVGKGTLTIFSILKRYLIMLIVIFIDFNLIKRSPALV